MMSQARDCLAKAMSATHDAAGLRRTDPCLPRAGVTPTAASPRSCAAVAAPPSPAPATVGLGVTCAPAGNAPPAAGVVCRLLTMLWATAPPAPRSPVGPVAEPASALPPPSTGVTAFAAPNTGPGIAVPKDRDRWESTGPTVSTCNHTLLPQHPV